MDKHKVSLKVLRLSRPVIRHANLVTGDPVPSPMLSLPGSFGTVHVGEPFNSLLSVAKDNGDGPPVAVSLSASMLLPEIPESNTGQRTVTLLKDGSEQVLDHSNSTHQHVLSYEAKDPGLHGLNVTITYRELGADGTEVDADSQTKSSITFRKNYRFTATLGISVKTKVSRLESTDLHLIEAQIENVSDSIMTLETVELLAQEGFDSSNCDEDANLNPPTLQPTDIWQQLFIVKRDEKTPAQASPHQSKLTLSWRREPMGEKGWLTTGEIKYA